MLEVPTLVSNDQVTCPDKLNIFLCILHDKNHSSYLNVQPILQVLQLDEIEGKLYNSKEPFAFEHSTIWCEYYSILVALTVLI